MKLFAFYTILTLSILWTNYALARTDSLLIQCDLPYLSKQILHQDIFLKSDSAFKAYLSFNCFKINSSDSQFIYSRYKVPVKIKKGVRIIGVDVKSLRDSGRIDPEIFAILKKTNALPAGNYHINVFVFNNNMEKAWSFSHVIDSALSRQSSSRRDLESSLAPDKGIRVAGIRLLTENPVTAARTNLARLEQKYNKIERGFKRKGLTTVKRPGANSIFFDVYYHDWFLGYYKLDTAGSVVGAIENERHRLAADAGSFASTELEDIQSIFTQMKKLNKATGENNEGNGELGLTTYLSTGQEENSANENNYYELHGQLEMPVMGIPVSIEGLYTSQDKNRKIKASYIRLHYDTEKAKDELVRLIQSYNRKYEQTASSGKGLEFVYNSYMQKLRDQQGKLMDSIRKQAGIGSIDLTLDTSALRKQITDSLAGYARDADGIDTAGINDLMTNAMAKADSIKHKADRLVRQYEKAKALERQVEKYEKLIDQYKNTNYFDSVLAYSKVKELEDADDLSYKQLSKKAESLLPNGRVKKFATGLTHLDAGIFSKQESSYTLAGQTIKGIDIGYDFGFCTTAFTVGKVEYAGRDGALDKYTGYSVRASFKPGKKQKASLIYFGYTPSRKMLTEESFFKDVDASMPSFTSPVHILSMTYSGTVFKGVHYEAEAAGSFNKYETAQKSDYAITDRMAYNIKVDGEVPYTSVALNGAYEHVGNAFENNTAPINLSGIERYTLGSKGTFFRNFLTLGVEYNYLEQQSFSGKGGNTKWGFEVATHSRRYPSLMISYKPFATFRSYSDTLDIPQRPLIGEVWTGRATYQLKKKEYNVRFTAIYNHNTSILDTIQTNASVTQFNTIWQDKKQMLMLNIGRTENSGIDTAAIHLTTTFLDISASRIFNERWSLSGGLDMGVARFGLSKYGATVGCQYVFQKIPITIRAMTRYNSYGLEERRPWRQLLGGSLDVLWRFRFKVNE
jgi:hypothetical protein